MLGGLVAEAQSDGRAEAPAETGDSREACAVGDLLGCTRVVDGIGVCRVDLYAIDDVTDDFSDFSSLVAEDVFCCSCHCCLIFNC